jgi:hypothetical protein
LFHVDYVVELVADELNETAGRHDRERHGDQCSEQPQDGHHTQVDACHLTSPAANRLDDTDLAHLLSDQRGN